MAFMARSMENKTNTKIKNDELDFFVHEIGVKNFDFNQILSANLC